LTAGSILSYASAIGEKGLNGHAEEGLRQSLVVSDGSWTIFVTKPISAVFLLVTALIVVRKAYVLLFKKDPS